MESFKTAVPAGLFRLLARLPLPALHAFGVVAGWLAYWTTPRLRRHLRENLERAFGAEEARRLLPRVVAETGKMALELPKVWVPPLESVVGQIRGVTGWEHLEAAWSRGEGVMLLSPHIGCFEIIAQYMATRAPMTALYRPPKQAWLRPIVEGGRRRPTLTMAPADLSGVRLLLRALKRGETVGILPDQAPSAGEGAWLPFFGAPAYTMTLAARLTEAGRVAVICAFAERLPAGCGFHVHFWPIGEPLEGDTTARAAAINRAVEAMARRAPEQYLWGYNRYKVPAGAEPPPTSS